MFSAAALAQVFQRHQQPQVAQGQGTLQKSARDVGHDVVPFTPS
jgi:hypothetical protein